MPAHCSQEATWDHDRDLRKHDLRPSDQRYVVADLVGYCEGITGAGFLPPEIELALRQRIAATLAAFNMPPKAEMAS
jgi:hypothetical protein